MLQSQFFVKKCKRAISKDGVLINNVNSVEHIFYDFFKIFDEKALKSVFDHYHENFDFDKGIYAFIDKFIPIINFLSLEVLDYEFSIDEKKLILEVFDSSACTLKDATLSEFARAIVSFGILD
ncbi:hypothetical protein BOFE_02540 [Candidatus Borrelia fainii]|uniref:Uncharacterized protein n=1 Tax=Candidatus Borrelia fainii TaxID=2518322 RepID=A0ABM8DJE5_9SPIR|nr:hypothetical protein [Candidatus Borrelia fainii]BDU62714.1 hypothetical protein BOFE_02540 [Candidatus Borrelia fainii]